MHYPLCDIVKLIASSSVHIVARFLILSRALFYLVQVLSNSSSLSIQLHTFYWDLAVVAFHATFSSFSAVCQTCRLHRLCCLHCCRFSFQLLAFSSSDYFSLIGCHRSLPISNYAAVQNLTPDYQTCVPVIKVSKWSWRGSFLKIWRFLSVRAVTFSAPNIDTERPVQVVQC